MRWNLGFQLTIWVLLEFELNQLPSSSTYLAEVQELPTMAQLVTSPSMRRRSIDTESLYSILPPPYILEDL